MMWLLANRKMIAIGAVFLAMGALYLYGYYQGRASVKQSVVIQTIKVVKDVQKIREGVVRLPDGASANELRKSWQR